MQTVFPGAALIFNVRQIKDTLNSGFWAAKEEVRSSILLQATIDRFHDSASSRSNCLVFSYTSLATNSEYCRTLFDFLGEKFDKDSVEKVLSKAHSYQAPRRKAYEGYTKKIKDYNRRSRK